MGYGDIYNRFGEMSYKLQDVRVLVVDDMKPMQDLLKAILIAFGFKKLYFAEDGDDAFHKFSYYDPDIIITDWMMHGESGIEFTHRVRNDSRSPNPLVPIIMMSGFSAQMRVEQARDTGITEFLAKPFTAQDVYEKISQVIEKPRPFIQAHDFYGPDRRRKLSTHYRGPMRREEDPEPTDIFYIETENTKTQPSA